MYEDIIKWLFLILSIISYLFVIYLVLRAITKKSEPKCNHEYQLDYYQALRDDGKLSHSCINPKCKSKVRI